MDVLVFIGRGLNSSRGERPSAAEDEGRPHLPHSTTSPRAKKIPRNRPRYTDARPRPVIGVFRSIASLFCLDLVLFSNGFRRLPVSFCFDVIRKY